MADAPSRAESGNLMGGAAVDSLNRVQGEGSAKHPEMTGLFNKKMIAQVLVVGTGFACDAYDLFVINNVLFIMNEIWPQTPADKSMVASTALWGAVAGQLFFGAVADIIGRKSVFLVTLVLIVIGAFGSALSFETPSFSVYQQLAMWRFILGLGVGGEYPLAASVAAESSSPKIRGRAIAAVFSMQGIGQLLAAAVINVCVAAGASYEFTWRFALAFGAVPALSIFYFRLKLEETNDFVEAKSTRISYRSQVKAAFRVWWPQILGCAGSWFLLDITFYGNGLFSSSITTLMGLGKTVQDAALQTLYTVLLGIPGYYFTVAFLDTVGRWNLQMIGFVMLVVLFVILGAAYNSLLQVPGLFIFLYGLTFFFSNFGPNSTTYIIPGEYFPAQVKSTCHGFSAASGKIGAAVAGWIFPPALKNLGLANTLFICAGVGAAGVLVTFLVPKYTADDLEGIKRAQLKEFHLVLDSEPEVVPVNEEGLPVTGPHTLEGPPRAPDDSSAVVKM